MEEETHLEGGLGPGMENRQEGSVGDQMEEGLRSNLEGSEGKNPKNPSSPTIRN